MINVSIIGATGYTGSELMRLLVTHPKVKLQQLTARKLAGTKVTQAFPTLIGFLDDHLFEALNLDKIKETSDLVFICLPHGHSVEIGPELTGSVKVIDLGADFRLKDPAVYEQYYGEPQLAPDQLDQAVYGLTEFNRPEIQTAQLIANPGCFVTNALLALIPLVQAQIVDPKSIIIDSKTGISGAGKGANVANLLSEAGNNFKAYNPLGHRHIPEIEQELGHYDSDIQVQLTPHLLPTERGIYSTIYATPTKEVTEDQVREIYQAQYKDEAFVHLLEPGMIPMIKSVRGSNHCHIQVLLDSRTGRIIILSAIDNLVKGAAGQAVQNMNLMFGLGETSGLQQAGILP